LSGTAVSLVGGGLRVPCLTVTFYNFVNMLYGVISVFPTNHLFVMP
jgi:hypothetical protein